MNSALNKALATGLRLSCAAFAAATLQSCAPKIELVKSPTLMSENWRGPIIPSAGNHTITNEGWSVFGSSELADLIEQARRRNPEIGIALARITQARGELGVTKAALLPSIDGRLGGGSAVSDIFRRDVENVENLFGSMNVQYELDLFGENKALKRADQARLLAAGYDADSTRLLVETTVARTYFQFVTLARREQILDQALLNARKLERIIRIRFDEGVATRVDLGLQTIEVRNLEADKSRLIEARNATQNALSVLVGQEAPTFNLAANDQSELVIPNIETIQPGALLVRRPDVKAGEARIAAANGDIQAARAAFLPDLQISAGSTGSVASFANPIAFGLNIAGELLAPIFSGGRLRGDMVRATGQQTEAVQTYRGVLLTALAETEDALTAIDQSSIRLRLLGDIVTDARTTAQLAREQYIGGVVDTRTVLESERELLAAEENHAIAMQENLSAVVDLYRAMGGNPNDAPQLIYERIAFGAEL
ncbi:TolC family protein [Parasphingorhabdus sp.]|uniref:TolC family protein n=1 Tax=Parasphingorhabdus sp. TaxID=2709688 RepID=UPI003D274DE9